jgi:hypothetical protein
MLHFQFKFFGIIHPFPFEDPDSFRRDVEGLGLSRQFSSGSLSAVADEALQEYEKNHTYHQPLHVPPE